VPAAVGSSNCDLPAAAVAGRLRNRQTPDLICEVVFVKGTNIRASSDCGPKNFTAIASEPIGTITSTGWSPSGVAIPTGNVTQVDGRQNTIEDLTQPSRWNFEILGMLLAS
jgi:hypothetical protein